MNKRQKGFQRWGLVVAALLAAGMPACLVPPFSTMQDARLAGKGKVELTPFYSSIGSYADGESRHGQDDLGLQGFFGTTRWLDVGFRYEYLSHPDSGGDYDRSVSAHTIAAGPKFSLVKDHIAICLPVGFAFGENIYPRDTWEFVPTALFTLPLGRLVDLNLSAKALIPLRKGNNTLYAVSLGMGIKPGRGALCIRPEAGILFDVDPDSEGYNYHLSIGLSYRFGL